MERTPLPNDSDLGPARLKAWRLWFSFRGPDLVLERRDALVKRTERSASLEDPPGPQAGNWIELRDARDRPIWRRILHDPFGYHVEVLGPDGLFVGHMRDRPRSPLVVIVPDLPDTRTVCIFAAPPGRPGPAGLLGQFDLRPEG